MNDMTNFIDTVHSIVSAFTSNGELSAGTYKPVNDKALSIMQQSQILRAHLMTILSFSYSWRKASIGLNFDALFAGKIPKTTPIKAEKPAPIMTTIGLITG